MQAIQFTYQLFVPGYASVPFEVRATCAEEACCTVRRNLKLSDYGMVEFARAQDGAWLVMRTTPFEYCDFLHIESWDGERFRSFGKADLGQNLLEAIDFAPERQYEAA